jgi:predicted DNA-binding antitoxin AbrB/MazE fold protein
MKTVKGVYENGKIKLLEKVKYKTNQKVLVTFLGEEKILEEEQVRNLSLTQPADFFTEYLTDEREDLYQDYAQKIKR